MSIYHFLHMRNVMEMTIVWSAPNLLLVTVPGPIHPCRSSQELSFPYRTHFLNRQGSSQRQSVIWPKLVQVQMLRGFGN